MAAAAEASRESGRVVLGRRGWRVCLTMALLPVALPFRAWAQHKEITDLYPVESTRQQVGFFAMLKFITSIAIYW